MPRRPRNRTKVEGSASGPPAPLVYALGVMTGAALGYAVGALTWAPVAAAALFAGVWLLSEAP